MFWGPGMESGDLVLLKTAEGQSVSMSSMESEGLLSVFDSQCTQSQEHAVPSKQSGAGSALRGPSISLHPRESREQIKN